jgi:hypothetical protein
MVDFNLTTKDHIHGLVAKLWLIMNKTLVPLTYNICLLLAFSNFDYGKYLPSTMDIDEARFGG